MREVSQYTHLVNYIAMGLCARMPASVDKADLIQSGMVGLLEAMSRYDQDSAASFETFARYRIRGAMLDEIRRGDWTPRSVYRKGRGLARGEIKSTDTSQILADLARSVLSSIDAFDLDIAFVSNDPGPAELAEHNDLIGRLIKAIDTLPERERQILAFYYDEGLQLKEIGALLGLTESRISQLRSQALKRLSVKVNH